METDEFDILFNRSKGIFQRWKVSLQSRITNGSELLLYTIEGKTDRIRSPIVGTILWLAELAEGEELRQGQKVAVVAGCDHSVVMKDMCADCGKNLRTYEFRILFELLYLLTSISRQGPPQFINILKTLTIL